MVGECWLVGACSLKSSHRVCLMGMYGLRENSSLSAALTYAIVIVFAVLFVAVNWSGPGRVLSLASVAVIACALMALHSKSFAAAVGAALLLVPLPLIAMWTNAGSATGVIGPLVLLIGVACWRTWRSSKKTGLKQSG